MKQTRYPEKLVLRMEEGTRAAIEKYRHTQEVIPSVSEAIRQLLTAGLTTKKGGKK